MTGQPPPERGGAQTYAGPVAWDYAPASNGEPDPGEVVWAWVAYEEDASSGKDRPIAVVGRTPTSSLVALMLSTRDRSGDRRWIPIASGEWDPQRRSSWIRVDRLLHVKAAAVRREGGCLSTSDFARVVQAAGAVLPAQRANPRGIRLVLATLRGWRARLGQSRK